MASTWEPFRSTSLPCPLDDDAVPTEPDHTIAALYHSRPNNSNFIGNYPGGRGTDRCNGRSNLGFVSVKNGCSRGNQMWSMLQQRRQLQIANRYRPFRTNLDKYDHACMQRDIREWLRQIRAHLASALRRIAADREEQRSIAEAKIVHQEMFKHSIEDAVIERARNLQADEIVYCDESADTEQDTIRTEHDLTYFEPARMYGVTHHDYEIPYNLREIISQRQQF